MKDGLAEATAEATADSLLHRSLFENIQEKIRKKKFDQQNRCVVRKKKVTRNSTSLD